MLSPVASIHLDAQTAAPALDYREQTPCISLLQIRIYKHGLERGWRWRLGVMRKVRVIARQKKLNIVSNSSFNLSLIYRMHEK